MIRPMDKASLSLKGCILFRHYLAPAMECGKPTVCILDII